MLFRLVTYLRRTFPSSNSPLVQLSLFHDKRGPVWLTLKLLTDELNRIGIDHVIIGGLAVYEHGYKRSTNDCDLLLTKAGHEQFREQLVGRYVKPKFDGAKKKFIWTSTNTPVDIIIHGERPGDGKESSIEFPDPTTCTQLIDNYHVITLPKLIELKLASYKRLPTGRAQDLADVVELIKVNNLTKSFADLLHPYIQDLFKEIIVNLEIDEQKKPIEEM